MLNLIDENVAYLLVSPCVINKTEDENFLTLNKTQSLLYNRDYSLISLTGYCGGTWDKSYIAYNQNNNDELREDALFFLGILEQNSIVVKYKGDTQLKLIHNDGGESLLSLQNYSESVENTKVYIYNGYYFSLVPEKRVYMIESKSQIKSGMRLEFFNNDKWNEKIVNDVDTEFENMYKLLIKYKKLRAVI